jgi:hypothetical protein
MKPEASETIASSESVWKRIWTRVRGLYSVRLVASPLIQRVQASFEGREAIYVEKGALRVRVSNIRGSAAHRCISADVEEIPTPGLGVGSFDNRKPRRPRRWGIGAGYLTQFSDYCWTTGYGGWSLFFDPKTVQAVLDLASHFPENMDSWERYNQIVRFLQNDERYLHANWQPVFPGSPVSARCNAGA